jgi:hypothetical protein
VVANLVTGPLEGLELFVEPPSHHFMNDRLFEPNSVPFAGDQLMAPYTRMRDVLVGMGAAVHTADLMPGPGEGGQKLYVSIANLKRYRQIAHRADVTLSAFFATECPAMDPRMYRGLRDAQRRFRRIFSWSDAASLEPYVGARLQLQRYFWAQSFDQVHEELWARTDRRLLVAMQGNKVPPEKRRALDTERLAAFEYFARSGELDLFGREWDQPPYRVGLQNIPYTFRRLERQARALWRRVRPDPQLEAIRKAWRGPSRSKAQTFSGYRFALCYENMALKGWITEKIFDCFFSGTVPIYLGATDIQENVWPECYIDRRRFGSHDDLREYITTMRDDEWNGYRHAAREYLASPDFRRFNKDSFADLFVKIVQEDSPK